MNKNVSLYFFSVTLVALSLTYPLCSLSAESPTSKEISTLKKKIAESQGLLKKSQKKRKKLFRDLKKSEQAISNANRSLNNISQKRKILKKELKSIKNNSDSLLKRIKKEQDYIARYVYHLYKREEAGAIPLKILLRNQNPAITLRELKYLQYISKERYASIGQLRADLNQMDKLSNDKFEKEAALKKNANQQKKHRNRLVREKGKKKEILKQVDSEIKSTEATIRGGERRLNKKIRELTRAREKRLKNTKYKNTKLPDPLLSGKTFKKLKGKLRLPVIGELKHSYGTRREGDISWKGIFISAKNGAQVVAVAPGEVVYSGWLGGFGNLVIIDHGGEYLSLYGNNESIFINVGDILQAGEKIASVGSTGGNRQSGLYFELRFKGKPFNPMKWVQL